MTTEQLAIIDYVMLMCPFFDTVLLVTFQNDDYTCKVATNIKEVSELIEAEYEYVCEMNSQKLFRKRK